jgi:hypothetical protein
MVEGATSYSPKWERELGTTVILGLNEPPRTSAASLSVTLTPFTSLTAGVGTLGTQDKAVDDDPPRLFKSAKNWRGDMVPGTFRPAPSPALLSSEMTTHPRP